MKNKVVLVIPKGYYALITPILNNRESGNRISYNSEDYSRVVVTLHSNIR